MYSTGGPSMTKYAAPGEAGSVVSYRPRYDHFIGGEYVPPASGKYFENPTPVTGETFTEIARGTAPDVDRAVAAAGGASAALGRTLGRGRAKHPEQDRRPDGAEPGDDRGGQVLGDRQAGPRDPGRRHPA